jgi:hypothetical protein
MRRRLVIIACAVSASGWLILAAAERATFILTDGERISGTVVFHTHTRENLIDNDFSLAVTPGQPEQIFHYAQVAVIDFVGGTPRSSELAQLPDDSAHLLVLRNGTTRPGQFVNMIGGDTLRWRDSNGSIQEMPITAVARVYLNADSARNTFNYTRPAGTTGQVAAAIEPAAPGETVVTANIPWNDTGIDVRRGETVRFSTRGQVMFGSDPSQIAGPDGNGTMKSASYPVPAMFVGGLIAKVGSGAPFPIGSNRNGVRMPTAGRLMLGVNDDYYPDNSGAFYVTISRGR